MYPPPMPRIDPTSSSQNGKLVCFTVVGSIHHVTSIAPSDLGLPGVRVGCEWLRLAGDAERALQRYIDQTQKRRRFMPV